MYGVGTVFRDLDDPTVNALTITQSTESTTVDEVGESDSDESRSSSNGIYTVVERVTPSQETASPMWCRYQVSHDEIDSRVAQGLLEEGKTLSPNEISTVKSLASAHPEAVPELEMDLGMVK